MVNLVDVLAQDANLGWLVARVKAIDKVKKKLTLVVGDVNNAAAPTVTGAAYLNSYYPVVGDIVHALTKDDQGVLVLGKIGGTFSALNIPRAGRNRFINSDFSVNQRAFTSTTVSGTWGLDHWYLGLTGAGTVTWSVVTAVQGDLPEGARQFSRLTTSGHLAAADSGAIGQKIEDARSLSGKQVVVSVWARANAAGFKIGGEFVQNFGSGGSASVYVPFSPPVPITTSWARYAFTVNVPALVGGITIAADSRCTMLFYTSAGTDMSGRVGGTIGLQNGYVDLWGFQAEEGLWPTRYEQRTYAEELRASQRYFQRWTPPALRGVMGGPSGAGRLGMPLPVPMRAKPSTGVGGTPGLYDGGNTGTLTSISGDYSTHMAIEYDTTTSSFSAISRPAILYQGGAAYFDLFAEV